MQLRRRHLLALPAALALAHGPARAADLAFVRIGSARPDGSYAPLGQALAQLLSAPPGGKPCDEGGACGVPGVIASVTPSAGSRANVRGLVDERLELALCQADAATWLAKGGGPLQTGAPAESLRIVAALGLEHVHLFVRREAGIATLADLRGKRLGLVEEGSGSKADGQLVLQAAALGPADLQLTEVPAVQTLQQLRDGALDAAIVTGMAPLRELSGGLGQALASTATLMALDDPALQPLLTPSGALSAGRFEFGAYAGLVPEGGIATVTTRTLLITTTRERPAQVEKLTRALWSDAGKAALKSAGFALPDIKDAVTDLPLMLHEGATAAYKALGAA